MATVRERVLVIDDDPVVRRILVAIMTSEGFSCAAAGSLAQARAQMAAFDPQLVLLDVSLTGESAFPLARNLRPRAGGPAVIMVSGHDDAAVAASALDAGALGYVTKPFTCNDLAIAVD